MAEPKPFASLTSGLLARKGGARPAMRRQALAVAAHTHAHGDVLGQDDLGWNDMGYDVDPSQNDTAERHDSGLTPMHHHEHGPATLHALDGSAEPAIIAAPEPVVVEQQRRIEALVQPAAAPMVEMPVAEAPARKPRATVGKRAAAGAKGNYAFTLRLDQSRHLQLRLASATGNRSAQQILIQLFDDYIAGQPMIAALAAQVPGAPNASTTGEKA